MAYQKHTWSAGENITASKLNNIENGVKNNDNVVIIKFEVTENSSNVFTVTSTAQYLAEKYNQAIAAIADDKIVIAKIDITTYQGGKDLRYLSFIKMVTDSAAESEPPIFFSEVHLSSYMNNYNQLVIQINSSEFVLCDSYYNSQNIMANNSSYQKLQKQ